MMEISLIWLVGISDTDRCIGIYRRDVLFITDEFIGSEEIQYTHFRQWSLNSHTCSDY